MKDWLGAETGMVIGGRGELELDVPISTCADWEKTDMAFWKTGTSVSTIVS
jgi:hypothetical protein